jgi:hypothetical protein
MQLHKTTAVKLWAGMGESLMVRSKATKPEVAAITEPATGAQCKTIKVTPEVLERINRRCIDWNMKPKEVVSKLLTNKHPKLELKKEKATLHKVRIYTKDHEKLGEMLSGTDETYNSVLWILLNDGKKTKY